MRLALLADIHSNLEALVAVLAHAREQGAEARVYLGDLVGYGADPAAVLERIEEDQAAGAVVVQGNHDAAVLDGSVAAGMNPDALAAIAFTRAELGQHQRAFLAGLPLLWRRGDTTLVHASAEKPGEFLYVTDPVRAARCLEAAPSPLVFAGHVHEPVLFYTSAADRPLPFQPVSGVAIPVPPRRRWLAIAGSVGQPRDGRPAASYAVFDDERRTLTFHRVAYDWPSAAAKVRAAGLPERLAARLERGE
ncbi:MAG TPA: metallophosphoesterase family protein [Anaeromyxobacter sp.]|nr:metallophosphoesterase family protein [Anaeromyxobacter sp.]